MSDLTAQHCPIKSNCYCLPCLILGHSFVKLVSKTLLSAASCLTHSLSLPVLSLSLNTHPVKHGKGWETFLVKKQLQQRSHKTWLHFESDVLDSLLLSSGCDHTCRSKRIWSLALQLQFRALTMSTRIRFRLKRHLFPLCFGQAKHSIFKTLTKADTFENAIFA